MPTKASDKRKESSHTPTGSRLGREGARAALILRSRIRQATQHSKSTVCMSLPTLSYHQIPDMFRSMFAGEYVYLHVAFALRHKRHDFVPICQGGDWHNVLVVEANAPVSTFGS